jgi:hypothetical protein
MMQIFSPMFVPRQAYYGAEGSGIKGFIQKRRKKDARGKGNVMRRK